MEYTLTVTFDAEPLTTDDCAQLTEQIHGSFKEWDPSVAVQEIDIQTVEVTS